MCGYCCGGTPVEKRGEGHRGCSVDCYNVPRPKPATRIAQLEADLAAARSALGAVEALANEWEADGWNTGCAIALRRRALATPPQPAPGEPT